MKSKPRRSHSYWEGVTGYRRQDLHDMIEYFFMYEQVPTFIKFDQRSEFDVDRIAKQIYDDGLDCKAQVEFLDKQWADDKAAWQVFFGLENKKHFVNEVLLALRRLEYPELFASQTSKAPEVEYASEDLSRFKMGEIRETHPAHYRFLRNEIYARHRDRDGCYACKRTGRKSPNQFDFEIDHKNPFAKGGLTVLENLQLLWRSENRRKGTKDEGE